MPRAERAAANVASGLREHLIGKARAQVARLTVADRATCTTSDPS